MCSILLFFDYIHLKLSFIRPETPPNTPQRVRIAHQQNERNARVLDSPQQQRVPRVTPGAIHFPNQQPANLNAGPIPFALGPGNAAPINVPAAVPNIPMPAPAVPLPVPVPNIPAHIPAPVPNVPDDPFAPIPGNVQVQFGGIQYNHLPAALAQQMAAIPPALPPARRGRGRLRLNVCIIIYHILLSSDAKILHNIASQSSCTSRS